MRVHIAFDFVDGPWGGGNQFLKGLRKFFRRQDIYTEDIENADVVIFNSHHNLMEVFEYKRTSPQTALIHRIDGPVYDVRGGQPNRYIDERIYRFNDVIADGTVFQSDWSRERNRHYGIEPAPYEATIMNAPDPEIFYPPETDSTSDAEPTKLIASSWSSNSRKGFDVYETLDARLDFDRFEFTFVGRSPVEFDNATHVDPVPSEDLADLLRDHDIFVTASRNDPCSNALIEALHCGLPAVARDDGGHPEIIREGGELFQSSDDVVEAVERVAADYKRYRAGIDLPSIDEVGEQYERFAREIFDDIEDERYTPKRATLPPCVLKVLSQVKKSKHKLRGLVEGQTEP